MGTLSPLVMISGVTAVIIGIDKAREYYDAFTEEKLSVIDIVLQSSVPGGRTQDDAIVFERDKAKILSPSLNIRGVTTADRSSSVSAYNEFFASFDKLNEHIEKVNDAITYINSKIPFANIGLIEVEQIPSESASEQKLLSAAEYNNLAIDVQHADIRIKEKKFQDGGISLTLTSEEDYDEPVNIELALSYSDTYNDFTIFKAVQFRSAPEPIDSTEIYEAAVIGEWSVVTVGGADDTNVRHLTLEPNGTGYYTGSRQFRISWRIVKVDGKYFLNESGFWQPGYDTYRMFDPSLPEACLKYPVSTFLTYSNSSGEPRADRRYTKN